MWKQLLHKWFGLEYPMPCESCVILRFQLDRVDKERIELLHRLLDKDKQSEPSIPSEELKPITPKFVPWRVRQEYLEAEDRKTAQLMRDKQKEIDSLEKELGVSNAG